MKKFTSGRGLVRVWLLLTLAAQLSLFSVPAASAQVTSGNLQGVVTDANSAVVSGAKVKVTNADTGISSEAVTNDQGFYRVTALVPGANYTVEVEAPGFARTVIRGVVVKLGSENSRDIQLAAAGRAEVVEIQGGSELLDKTQSQLSTNFDSKQITQLPFFGLVDNLALLVPGVLTPGDTDFTNGVGISANGNRGRSNNFQIDGQDNNDNSVAGPSLFITNTEAIGEFQVITNTFSAEFGRNSGAQINTITKPGTNEYHGALFEYLTNSRLNARDNIEKKAQQEFQALANLGINELSGLANRLDHPTPFTENRFGGALGGPIKKDKAFFFATYERTVFRGEAFSSGLNSFNFFVTPGDATFLASRFANPATAALTSPLVAGGPAFAQGVGAFSCLPAVSDTDGDGIADDFTFDASTNFLAPLARVSSGGGLRTIFGCEGLRQVRTDSQTDQIIGRVDYHLSQNDRITGRYIFDDTDFPLAVGRFLAGAIFDVPSRNNNLGLSYTKTFSDKLVNEARFNFSRLDVRFGDPTGTLPGPGIQFAGTRSLTPGSLLQTFGTQNNLPQSRLVDVYQYQDTVLWTRGEHGLKFGADIRHQAVDNFFLPNFLGTYTFQSGGTLPANTFFNLNGTPRTTATALENFLLARPTQISFALGNPRAETTQNDFFFFIQDDWRIKDNLTLNLGLRYEVSTTPFNPLIEDVLERESDPSRAIFNQAFPLETRTAQKLPIDKNNFGPRVGFAWSPDIKMLGDRFTDGKTVIRGGFGIAYDPPYFNIVLNTVTAAPFAAAGTVVQTPGAPGSVTFPFLPSTTAQLNTTPGTAGGDPRLFNQTRVDPELYNPYTMSFNFGIQQELFRGSVLEVRYVGSRIVGQFQTVNGNPDLRFLAIAGNFLFGDPTRFTSGVPVTPFAGQPAPSAGNNFSSRAGTTGNGRVDPNFGNVRTRINGASSTYHGLQTRFDTRIKQLTMSVNYTFSKTLDNVSEIFSTLGGGTTVAHSQNPFDTSAGERGLSAFHQKHSLVSNFVYEFPFYTDQRGVVGKLLGGWQTNGIIRLGSGRAYTPNTFFGVYDPGFELAFIGAGALRPFTGNPNAPEGTIAFGATASDVLFGVPANPGQFVVFNTHQPGTNGQAMSASEARNAARVIYNDFGLFTRFGVPLDFLEAFNMFQSPYGDLGRNTEIGDPFYLVNLSLFKSLKLTEGTKLEFRVEAVNIFNHRNFGVPDPITEDASNGLSVATYQNPGANNGGNRQLRLGLRFIF
jgi:hypothetical protein